jgi:hypothetical protein
MPWGAVAGAVGAIGGALISGHAANKASKSQGKAADAGIEEQRRQFDAIQKLLAPYVTAGTGALTSQQDLAGLNGAGPQQAAIAALQASPAFTSAKQQGEDSILAHAAATGGLRGGNVQAALGQFSPQLLSSMINDQYTKLGGLTSTGLGAATMTGNAGLNTSNQVAGLLQQAGAAQAGGALAQGRAWSGALGGLGQAAGLYFGAGGNPFTTPNAAGAYSNPAAPTTFEGINPHDVPTPGRVGGDFSDARLKENIVPIGMTRRGNRLYRWEWKATGLPGAGVIAQEVEHIPGAVSVDPATGFKRVRYERV